MEHPPTPKEQLATKMYMRFEQEGMNKGLQGLELHQYAIDKAKAASAGATFGTILFYILIILGGCFTGWVVIGLL